MSDPINQKISQFLDDDLNHTESLQLLKALQQQPQLQSSMQRYMLINQALKSRPAVMADASFVDQLKQKLEQEPIYLLPQRKPKTEIFKMTAIYAAAASLAIAIVMAPAMVQHNPASRLTDQILAQQSATPSAQYLVANEQSQTTRLYPVNKRFRDYLLAHDGSMYTNGAANFQYRTQLASYSGE